MSIFTVLNFTGDTPDVDVSAAPNYTVGAAKVDGTEKVVSGDFDAAQINALIAAPKTLLTAAQATAQARAWGDAWVAAYPTMITGI